MRPPGPHLRLALLAGALGTGLLAFWAFEIVRIDDVRAWLEPAGGLGARIDDPASPTAVLGIAGLVVTAVVGAELVRRATRRRGGDRATG